MIGRHTSNGSIELFRLPHSATDTVTYFRPKEGEKIFWARFGQDFGKVQNLWCESRIGH